VISSEPAIAAPPPTLVLPASGAGSQDQTASDTFARIFASISSSLKDGKAPPTLAQAPKQNASKANVNPDPSAIVVTTPVQPAIKLANLMKLVESETQSEPSQPESNTNQTASSSTSESTSTAPAQLPAYQVLFNRTSTINVSPSEGNEDFACGTGASACRQAASQAAPASIDKSQSAVVATNSAQAVPSKPAPKANNTNRSSGTQAAEPNGPNLIIPLELPQTAPEPLAKDAASAQDPSSVSDVSSSGRSSPDANVQAPPASSSPTLPAADIPAFAMRITADSQGASEAKGQTAPTASSLPDSGITAAQAASILPVVRAAEPKALAEHEPNQAESTAAAFVEARADAPSVHAGVSRAESVTPAPSASDIDAKPQAAQNEPVRNVHMQLSGDDNQHVDVKLVDRGGELRVSVKAGDTNLAQSLQDHMPELTTRLDQQRFRTEVWSPREPAPSQSHTSSSGRGSSSSNSDGNSGRRQNRQQKERPEWLDELENQPRRAQTTRSN
jgi:hypothetical protein